MKTIAYIPSENGCGKITVLFFKDIELSQKILEMENFRFCDNVYYLTFPDVIDLDQCGFNFVDDEFRGMVEK